MSGILTVILGRLFTRTQFIHTQILYKINSFNHSSLQRSFLLSFPYQISHILRLYFIEWLIVQQVYIIILMQDQSNSTEVVIEGFSVVVKNIIRQITSSSISQSRKLLLITTGKGFVLCDLTKLQYLRFEHEHSPFYIKPKQNENQQPHGSQLGSILQSRTQVALVPNFNSDRYRKTYVYIYDYNIKTILSRFNFNLPINMFSLTNNHIIVSNNKRIVLYNYRKSRPSQAEQYYLQTYKSDESIDFIKFFDLFCHLCDDKVYNVCECGKYCYSKKEKYMKLFYMRIGFSQNVKSRILYYYDQKLDKCKFFYEQKPYNQHFYYDVNEEGKYLAICEDYGRKINIYNLVENCLYTVLHLGRQPKSIVNLNIITLPDKTQWAIASRQKEGTWATMHLFKLAKTSPTQIVPSIYKRKFTLYKQTMKDYRVFAKQNDFIKPQHFTVNSKLFLISVLGQYCQVIDLNKAGLHDQGNINDYTPIEQYKRQ